MDVTTSGMNLRGSRVFLVAGGGAALLTTFGLIWAQAQPPGSWAFPIAMAAWCVVLVGGAIMTVGLSARSFRAMHLRPARFVVVPGAFDVPLTMSPGFNAVMLMPLAGMFVVQAYNAWRDASDGGGTAFALGHSVAAAVIGLLSLGVAWGAWRGLIFRLTPEAITWRGLFWQRIIPWEALAPGGPPRPALGWATTKLGLAVTRPELVRQSGWMLGAGSRHEPLLPLQNDIHPWFLADAIRWYAEHPEHCTAIGTAAEHDRLRETLGVKQDQAAAPQMSRPGAVSAAVWLSYTAAAWGVVISSANVFLAFSFRQELVEAEAAWRREEERLTGQPVGELLFGGADIAQEWAIVLGIATILMGLGAVLLARRLRQGSNAARFGLLILSVIAFLYSACSSCISSPFMAAPDQLGSPLEGLILGTWMLNQTVTFALAVSLFVLLLLPSTQRYAQN